MSQVVADTDDDSACSAISEVRKDLLSIILCMRASFEGESLGAMLSALIAVSRKSSYVKFLIVMQRSVGEGGPVFS